MSANHPGFSTILSCALAIVASACADAPAPPAEAEAISSAAGTIEAAATAPSAGHYVLLNSFVQQDKSMQVGETESQRKQRLAQPLIDEAKDFFANEVVQGYIVRLYWPDIEVAKGTFDWGFLERFIQVAKSKGDGKRVFVQVQLHSFKDGRHTVPHDLLPSGESSVDGRNHAATWKPAVNDRFLKFFEAFNTWRKGKNGIGKPIDVAGLILPESACDECDKGYTVKAHLKAMEDQLTKAAQLGMTKELRVFQFINSLSTASPIQEVNAFCALGKHALAKGAGLGAPDGRYFNPKRANETKVPLYHPASFVALKAYSPAIPILIEQQGEDYLVPQTYALDLWQVRKNLGADYVGWLNYKIENRPTAIAKTGFTFSGFKASTSKDAGEDSSQGAGDSASQEVSEDISKGIVGKLEPFQTSEGGVPGPCGCTLESGKTFDEAGRAGKVAADACVVRRELVTEKMEVRLRRSGDTASRLPFLWDCANITENGVVGNVRGKGGGDEFDEGAEFSRVLNLPKGPCDLRIQLQGASHDEIELEFED